MGRMLVDHHCSRIVMAKDEESDLRRVTEGRFQVSPFVTVRVRGSASCESRTERNPGFSGRVIQI
jgi:hypothetical protein